MARHVMGAPEFDVMWRAYCKCGYRTSWCNLYDDAVVFGEQHLEFALSRFDAWHMRRLIKRLEKQNTLNLPNFNIYLWWNDDLITLGDLKYMYALSGENRRYG